MSAIKALASPPARTAIDQSTAGGTAETMFATQYSHLPEGSPCPA
jgi:hypothetical protein